MDPRRSTRVAETMREELEELLTYELSDPRIDVSGVAEVLISPDAKNAHVRLLLQGDEVRQNETLAAINGARGHIKRLLASRLDLFRMPELHFEPAVSVGLADRFEHILKRVRKGRPRD
jgi:ribosome-binding factor A